jgi:hypothetical protein
MTLPSRPAISSPGVPNVVGHRTAGEDLSLGFWEGPGHRDLAEFFAYERLVDLCDGVCLPWSLFMAERMGMILRGLGYD